MTDSSALVVTLFALVIAAVVVFSIYSYRRNRGRRSQPLGGSGASAARPAPSPGRRALSASEARDLALALQHSGAQWPEIVPALNARQDPEVERILISIRGPHLFDPYTGLTVIRHGCDLALSHDPKASILSALIAAKESMDKVIRAGD